MTNSDDNRLRTHKGYGYQIYFVLFILFVFFVVKPQTLQAVQIYALNSESRTISRIDTATDQVQTAFASLGIIPNKFVMDEDYIWCVNSGDNAVQKINRLTGSTVGNILVETACNPWDACLSGNYLYVTGMFTDKVYKIDTTTDTVVGYVSVGIAPEALCVYNGKLYVTNTGGYQNNYAGSSVSVIDLESYTVETTIPVSANPQYIIEKEGLLHVSCTGNWTSVLGAVCIINPVTNTVLQTINIGGSVGGIWINNQHQGLVGDGSGINLYRYDTTDYSIINGSDNPLPGGSAVDGNVDMVALLYPNWGNNGKVKLLHPDFSYWKEYNVGMAPTDMKIWQIPTNAEDEENVPIVKVSAYPNPVHSGQPFHITVTGSKVATPFTGMITIYNLKGQLVNRQQIANNKDVISTHNLAVGCYLYKVDFGSKKYNGKIVVLH